MVTLKKLWHICLDIYRRLDSDNITSALIVLVVLIILIIIPTFLSGKYHEPDFLDNILGEANGMVLDLLIFGVFVTWLSSKRETKRQVLHYKDEIDDFRNWPDQTAARRIRGNIRRLNKLGVHKMDLHECYLVDANLADINLKGSDIWGANLSGCDLDSAEMQRCDLWKTNLTKTILQGADFTEAKLNDANLTGSNLSGVILKGANLTNTNFQDANLNNAILDDANLTGVEGLEPIQLSKVKSLNNILLDEKLLIKARQHNQKL